MPDIRTTTTELQSQILDSVRKSQEFTVDALKAWADAVRSVTPVSVPAVPFADRLPKPGELVADAYDFAGQLLAAQRKFTEDVVRITSSVTADETN